MQVAPDLPDANIIASGFYLLSATAACPHCGFEIRVFALAVPATHQWLQTDDADESNDAWQSAHAPAVLFHVAAVSAACALQLRDLAPGYRPSFSSCAEGSRWMNHCGHCDAALEDDDLHCEPEAAFLPISPAAARMLGLKEIREPIQANAVGYAPEAHWLAHATRG